MKRCRERKRGPEEEEEVEGARATPAADPPKVERFLDTFGRSVRPSSPPPFDC